MSASLRVREYENFTRRMREPEGKGNASHAVVPAAVSATAPKTVWPIWRSDSRCPYLSAWSVGDSYLSDRKRVTGEIGDSLNPACPL